jgi:hypothetical protein
MSDVLTPKFPRAGGFPKAPAPTWLCVFRSPALFSARSQHTQRPDGVRWFSRPLALFSAMAHSISSIAGPLPVFTWFPCVDRQLQRAYYLDFARAARAPRRGGAVCASYITELCLPYAVQTQNLKAHHLGLDQRMSSCRTRHRPKRPRCECPWQTAQAWQA